MTYDPAQGDGAQLMDIMQMQAALNGYSIVDPSEAAVTPGSSSLTVDVAGAPSGARLGGPAESFSGETGVTLPSPDSTDPRKALVYLDSSGTVQTLGGTPAAAEPSGDVRAKTGVPTVPIPAFDFLPLAEVWLPAGASDITSSDIFSRRMPFSQGSGSGLNADLVRGERLSNPPLYGDGSDGEIVVSNNTTDSGMYHTTRYEIQSGNTLTLGGNCLIVFAKDEIVIDGTVDGSGVNPGGIGGYDESPYGRDGTMGIIGATSSGGNSGDNGGPGAGGGGGSSDDDSGASVVKLDYFENLNMYPSNAYDALFSMRLGGGSGGGGGGGGGSGDAYGGDGGDGGGAIFFFAPSIEINGTINVEGTDGGDGQSGASPNDGGGGGGGGGSGGLLTLIGESITDNSTFLASGGLGGAGEIGNGTDNGDGGDGGDGAPGEKIIIESP